MMERRMEDVNLPPTGCCLGACVITWRQRRRLLIALVGEVEGEAKNIKMTSARFCSVLDNSHKIKRHIKKLLAVRVLTHSDYKSFG